MKRNKFLIFFFLFLIGIVIASNPTPIGYEYFTYHGKDHIHTWNNNPLGENESNIWFNGKNNNKYVEFFNGEDWEEALERSEWIDFNYGIGYYDNGFNILTTHHLNDAEHNITSDNETYWDMNVYKCDTFAELVYCAGWNRGQQVNDRYMRNSFFFETDNFPYSYNTSYLWGFENINIGDNDITDLIQYCFIENDNEYCNITSLDNTGEFMVYNLTQLYIYDSVINAGHSLLWERDIDVRLRYNDGEFMLEAPMNIYEGWSGKNIIDMFWIDYDISYEKVVDATHDYSGYIYYNGSTYTVYTNTNAQVYAKYFSTVAKRGYLGFNVSWLPDGVTADNITTIQLYHPVVSRQNSPWAWKTRFSSSSTINTLTSLDYNVGKSAVLIDWGVQCGANEPCTTWIALPSTGTNNVTDNLLNAKSDGRIFTIAVRDNSLTFFTDTWWEYIIGVTFHSKAILQVNFTVPDYEFNISLNYPANNSVFVVNNSDGIIEFALNGTNHGEYLSDFCTFSNSYPRVRTNATDVNVNDSIGYGNVNPVADRNFTRFGYGDNGTYWWEANCTDLWGKKAYSGKFYFTIESVDEDIDDWWAAFYLFMFCLAILLILMGGHKGDWVFTFFGGLVLLILGLIMGQYSFPNFAYSWMDNVNLFIFVFLGIGIMLIAVIKALKGETE